MRKWECGSITIAALIAVYFTTVLNIAFWRRAWELVSTESFHSILFAISVPLLLFFLTFAAFCLLLWPYVGKAILSILLVASATASYFMFNLNVLIDTDMLRNVFATNPKEAGEMFTFTGAVWIVAMGILPAFLLCWTKIIYRSPLREVGRRFLLVCGSLILAAGLLLGFFKDYSAVGRNNRMLAKLINPANYISSTIRYCRKQLRANREFVVIDEDPLHMPYEDPYYTVLVIVVGETARAMNFSLNGYERETNPKLAKQDIVNFGNVTSSGTATAFSLPCMFSHLSRTEFDVDLSRTSENLLDVMQKAGYAILWRDNDSGSKGVADRVEYEDLMRDGNPKFRNGDTFYDEVLLDGLEERLRKIDGDTVIVLHMMGSHGPSYYRRYPDAFKVFTPACDTAEIQSRPREEIVNTYDNTILYTDHVLSETIDILKRHSNHEIGMIYVSDHGESLGENGIFLHGFPYSLAPREQTHVPMLLWMSETMKREDHVDYEKLRRAAGEMELTHDNLFHSILGLVEVDSDLYKPELDLFRDFRTRELPSQEKRD